MKGVVANDVSEARRMLGVCNALEGLPKRGVSGPGRQTVAENPGPGWSLYSTHLAEHPSNGNLALVVDTDLEMAIQDETKLSKLSEQDQLFLVDVHSRLVTFGSGWLTNGNLTPKLLSPDNPIPFFANVTGLIVGAATNSNLLGGAASEEYPEVLVREFNSVSSETDMKWPKLQPELGVFDFTAADALVGFVSANGLKLRGHVLVWNRSGGIPDYLPALNAAQLEAAMDEHIDTVVGRYATGQYAGTIDRWEVVNEPFANDGSHRPNKFYNTLGEAYIDKAFIRARTVADPGCELWLNEAGVESISAVGPALVALCDRLVDDGVPIDGVGLQCHLQSEGQSTSLFDDVVGELLDLGLKVAITEMDFRLEDHPNRLQQQAALVNSFVGNLLNAGGSEVTCWGFTDAHSWINFNFPGEDYQPLLFDDTYQPKPAYEALRSILAKKAGFL